MRPSPKGRRSSIAAISVAVIAASAGGARAQSAEAEQLFADGNKRMVEGKLAEACDAFEASNRIESRAGTLIRLGECREQRHELASAWSAYKDALTRVKDKHKRDVATKRASALEARLSYLTITVADRTDGLAITRGDKPVDASLWNRALPIDGGDYTISARATGHDDWQTTAHVPAEGGKIVIEVPKLVDRPQPVTSVDAAHPVGAPVPAGSSPSRRDTTTSFTIQRKLAAGVGGLAVASAIAAIVLGEAAKGKEHDAFALCPDMASPCANADRANGLLRTGHTRALESNIGFGVAAATAIGAAVMWFVGGPSSERSGIAIAPRVLADQASLVVTGTL